VDVDESFCEREAYREGSLTDAPDFSRYDKMLEDDNEATEDAEGGKKKAPTHLVVPERRKNG
jgi:hypothetical protein